MNNPSFRALPHPSIHTWPWFIAEDTCWRTIHQRLFSAVSLSHDGFFTLLSSWPNAYAIWVSSPEPLRFLLSLLFKHIYFLWVRAYWNFRRKEFLPKNTVLSNLIFGKKMSAIRICIHKKTLLARNSKGKIVLNDHFKTRWNIVLQHNLNCHFFFSAKISCILKENNILFWDINLRSFSFWNFLETAQASDFFFFFLKSTPSIFLLQIPSIFFFFFWEKKFFWLALLLFLDLVSGSAML